MCVTSMYREMFLRAPNCSIYVIFALFYVLESLIMVLRLVWNLYKLFNDHPGIKQGYYDI